MTGDVHINVKFRRVHVAFDISMQCACAILSSVILRYFSVLSHKRHDFRNKNQYKMRVFVFSTSLYLGRFSF